MRTPLSSPYQLRLGGWLSHLRLSRYTLFLSAYFLISSCAFSKAALASPWISFIFAMNFSAPSYFPYHKWPLTDLWLLDLIIKVFKKAKLDKQQKMLLSLRFIFRHTVLKYMIVVVCAPEQPTTWSLPIVLHIGVLLFLK